MTGSTVIKAATASTVIVDVTIYAGKDDDRIDGGEGDDWMLGNRADVFHLLPGNDIIYDFSYDEGDRLEIDGFIGYQQLGNNLLVTYDEGSTLSRM